MAAIKLRRTRSPVGWILLPLPDNRPRHPISGQKRSFLYIINQSITNRASDFL
jgi:hypothetical protein